MSGFRKNELEQDPWSRYDFSYNKEDYNPQNFVKHKDNTYSLALIYKQECSDLMDLILGTYDEGKDYYYNDLSEDKLKKLEEKYSAGAVAPNKYGELKPVDPLKNWNYDDDSIEESVAYEAGHFLGLKGKLGIYYKLLSDSEFARGYWLGCAKKLIEEDNFDKLKILKSEIDDLRPGKAEEEMKNIISLLLDDDNYAQVMYDKLKRTLNVDFVVTSKADTRDLSAVDRFKNELNIMSREIFQKRYGLDEKFEIDLPEEKLILLEEKYLSQVSKKDSFGNDLIYDPLNDLRSLEFDVDDVICEIAQHLADKNELGKYFRLLSDSRFAHSFWLARASTLIEENNIEGFTALKNEIEELWPETFEEEMESIVDTLSDIDDEFTNVMYDFANHLGPENELGKYFKEFSDSSFSDNFVEVSKKK